MILRGKKVDIRPLTPEEADLVFEWSTQSDATPFWYGEIYGTSVPTKQEFFADFKPYYFDGSEPEGGRAFAIERQGQIIGHLHYDRIDRTDNSVELDIMIMDKQNWSHGYGSDALQTLCSYLFENKGIEVCRIEANDKNPRALKAYQKAGFGIAKTYERPDGKWTRLECKSHSAS